MTVPLSMHRNIAGGIPMRHPGSETKEVHCRECSWLVTMEMKFPELLIGGKNDSLGGSLCSSLASLLLFTVKPSH